MISVIFLYLAGVLKGYMDTLQFHYGNKPKWMKEDAFWDPKLSWRNKYKDIDGDGLGDVAAGPKYFLSTTAFVAYTDGWHLMQAFFLLTIAAGVVSYNPMVNYLIDFLIIRTFMYFGFKTTYR